MRLYHGLITCGVPRGELVGVSQVAQTS